MSKHCFQGEIGEWGRCCWRLIARQGDWPRAFRESSLNPDFFVHRTRDLDEVFPWDFIDHGIPKEKLKEEYLKAMKEADIEIVG